MNQEQQFTEWFVQNYPGPDTIIHDPRWHAPRIYRAATAPTASPAALTDDALIDAANARADLYEGDDRPCIKTDVMNAFYAGAEFAKRAAPADQDDEAFFHLIADEI